MTEKEALRIKTITEKIVKRIHPEKLILFGSSASGQATAGSDIDIMVIWNTALNPHQRNLAVSKLFYDRDFPLDVFVFTPDEERRFRNIPGTMLYEAETKGKVLYERR